PPTVFSPFPYTTLFRSRPASPEQGALSDGHRVLRELAHVAGAAAGELPRERHRDDQEAAIFPAGPSHSAAVAANARRRDCLAVCADAGVLLLPKILGVLLTLRDRHLRRQFGGAARLCLSLLVEQFFSV